MLFSRGFAVLALIGLHSLYPYGSVQAFNGCASCSGIPGRGLSEVQVWDELAALGAVRVLDDEAQRIAETCGNEEYKLVLYTSPGPHFFAGALSESSKLAGGCPSLGFASVEGERVILKGDPQTLERFDLSMDSFKLDDVLESFHKSEPIGSTAYAFESNTCIHFASRIWRKLGLVESEALGDFLVENIVNDPNLIELARRNAGSIAVVAATIFGPDALRGHIEKVVFSQLNIPGANALRERRLAEPEKNSFDFSQFGMSLGFDERHLEGSACNEAEYDVDLILVGTPLIFVEPAPDAPAGCSAFLLHTTTLLDEFGQLNEGQELFKKEVIRFDDAIPFFQSLTELRGTVITEGKFELQAIIQAYYDARTYSDPVEGESMEMHFTKSVGVFVADFFNLLGHNTTESEITAISAGLMMSDPNVVAALRMTANETIAAIMTDMELVNWVVEQTVDTVNMTVVGKNE